MIADLFTLPPGFRAVRVADEPFDQAVAAVAAHTPGTVLWLMADGRCRAAVVLAPDRPIAARTLTALGLLALYDALAVLAPPQMPIAVTEGDCLRVDGGRAAWVRMAMDAGPVPEWAVLGVEVALDAAVDNPGEAPDETCLAEEGFGAVSAAALLDGFCRHLLAWIEDWRDEGAASLDRAVAARRSFVVPA